MARHLGRREAEQMVDREKDDLLSAAEACLPGPSPSRYSRLIAGALPVPAPVLLLIGPHLLSREICFFLAFLNRLRGPAHNDHLALFLIMPPTPVISNRGRHFIDEEGRVLWLRGANVGAASKVPV